MVDPYRIVDLEMDVSGMFKRYQDELCGLFTSVSERNTTMDAWKRGKLMKEMEACMRSMEEVGKRYNKSLCKWSRDYSDVVKIPGKVLTGLPVSYYADPKGWPVRCAQCGGIEFDSNTCVCCGSAERCQECNGERTYDAAGVCGLCKHQRGQPPNYGMK
jgi:hypothetical protein